MENCSSLLKITEPAGGRMEMVLPDALHSIRSLLCTATNCTPHERLFNYQRRSSTGRSIPTWLANSGSKVLLKRAVRASKYDPLVEEVELIEANPDYAYIKYPDGRDSTVSLRWLSPLGDTNISSNNEKLTYELDHLDISLKTTDKGEVSNSDCFVPPQKVNTELNCGTETDENNCNKTVQQVETLRRSGRLRKPPKYFHDEFK